MPSAPDGEERPDERAPSPTDDDRVHVLFVCLGNICRSPTAEAIMLARVSEAGLAERVVIDSAGTGRWHVGSPPDERSMSEARRRGIAMTSTARQVHIGDFEYFDLLLAMDSSNLADLNDLALDDTHRAKVGLVRCFDPALAAIDPTDPASSGRLDVPDPYYGGPSGFSDVFELLDDACRGLLGHIADERLL